MTGQFFYIDVDFKGIYYSIGHFQGEAYFVLILGSIQFLYSVTLRPTCDYRGNLIKKVFQIHLEYFNKIVCSLSLFASPTRLALRRVSDDKGTGNNVNLPPSSNALSYSSIPP